jgi:hypothetical protein
MNANELPINEPCHENWDAMSGRGPQRFCGSCTKHVHDLSAMTKGEVATLLQRETAPCVRYSCGPDGALVFKQPTPVTKPAPTHRRSKRALLMAAAMVVAAPAIAADAPSGDREPNVLEQLAEVVVDWWNAAPEGCAGPGPVPTRQVAIPELQSIPIVPAMPMMGEIAMPLEPVIEPVPPPVVTKPVTKRMGKIAMTDEGTEPTRRPATMGVPAQ